MAARICAVVGPSLWGPQVQTPSTVVTESAGASQDLNVGFPPSFHIAWREAAQNQQKVVFSGLWRPLCSRPSSVQPGASWVALVQSLDLGHLGDVGLEVPLDAHLQCDHAARAAHARAVEADLHHACVGHVHEFDIAAVGLHGGTDEFDHPRDAVEDGGGGGSGGHHGIVATKPWRELALPMKDFLRGGTDAAAVLVLMMLAGCGSSQPARLPLEVLQDRSADGGARVAALEEVAKQAETNASVRGVMVTTLEEIAVNPQQPRGLRVEAIERLLKGDQAERMKVRFAGLVVREPDPAIVSILSDRAAREKWAGWSAPLVRVWAREGGRPTQQEIEKGASPSFAASGERALRLLIDASSDSAINEVLWKHTLDGAGAGGVASDTNASQDAEVRRDAWTVLARRDADGSVRRGLLASGSAPTTEAGQRVIEGLRAGVAEWRVLPKSGEELRWMLALRQGSTPAHEAWRAGVREAIAKTGDVGELRMRHLEPMRWANAYWPEALGMSRQQLAGELAKAREGRRLVSRSWAIGAKRLAYREDGGGDGFAGLSWGDLLNVLVLDRAIGTPSVARSLVQQAMLDHRDSTSEYGGLFLETAATRGVLTPVLYPPRAKDKRGDLMFAAPDEMIRDQDMAAAQYHFHAAALRNSEAAGPSEEDVAYAGAWERGCLVFTSVREGLLNVDYYQPGGEGAGVVVDLGVIGEGGWDRGAK